MKFVSFSSMISVVQKACSSSSVGSRSVSEAFGQRKKRETTRSTEGNLAEDNRERFKKHQHKHKEFEGLAECGLFG